MQKNLEHQKAIVLRENGKSYGEIKSIIHVSSSTLSLWLHNIPLSKKSKNLLLIKKQNGQRKGGLAKKLWRKKIEEDIINKSSLEISQVSKREIWLLGIIAYWCEGAKQKENNVSQRVVFSNSDQFLLKLFLFWLRNLCKIKEEEITYSLYIHQNANTPDALRYWIKTLKIPSFKLISIVLKKNIIKTNRKNISFDYHGLIRITVKKSTNLNRRIKGWIVGINNSLN